MKRLLVISGLIAVCIAGMLSGVKGVSARGAGLASPSKLVLQRGDLPGGFKLQKAASQSYRQIVGSVHVNSTAMRNNGFVAGYETQFEHTGVNSSTIRKLKGVLYVDDAVVSFHSTAGAHNVLETTVPMLRTLGYKFHMVSFGRMGNEHLGYTYNLAKNGVSFTLDALVFRHGTYDAFLITLGRAMTLGRQDSQVAGLANKIDARIARNG